MAEAERTPVAGSERAAISGAPAGAADPAEQTSVTVYLRGPAVPDGIRLSRDEWAESYGASGEDADALAAFAEEHGLAVGEVNLARRAVVLTGTVADLTAAFGTEVTLVTGDDGRTFRARQGPLSVPSPLGDIVTAVVGIDERPQARSQLRPSAESTAGYSALQVADAYNFPAGTDGSGQTVAIIELGGGYREADLDAYFSSLGLQTPSVSAIGVDGGSNSPGTADGPDGEVMLDIEVIGAVAPGAALAVYFAPNTDQGFIDAVSNAVHDTTYRPSAVSISWGGPESTWTAQSAQQMEQVFVEAAALGVTVTVAAGDNGSSDGVSDGAAHVDFPASAPHALACGGTRLEIGATANTETVWGAPSSAGGATGGGVSDIFALPAYQASAGVPSSANPDGRVGRGVPDVCGDADPSTGYRVRVDGADAVYGGTSAVAPLWAALVARLNQSLGTPVGDLHDFLYSHPSTLHDVVDGSNGAYHAGPGWDPCSGLGSPDGAALLDALGAAGKPAQTAG